MSECSRCPILQSEIERQQAEIQKLKQIITEALGVCSAIANAANSTMKKGGIPRGSYAYHKAQKETAEKVIRYLGR